MFMFCLFFKNGMSLMARVSLTVYVGETGHGLLCIASQIKADSVNTSVSFMEQWETASRLSVLHLIMEQQRSQQLNKPIHDIKYTLACN